MTGHHLVQQLLRAQQAAHLREEVHARQWLDKRGRGAVDVLELYLVRFEAPHAQPAAASRLVHWVERGEEVAEPARWQLAPRLLLGLDVRSPVHKDQRLHLGQPHLGSKGDLELLGHHVVPVVHGGRVVDGGVHEVGGATVTAGLQLSERPHHRVGVEDVLVPPAEVAVAEVLVGQHLAMVGQEEEAHGHVKELVIG